jgi:hypothetical protein
MKDAKTGQNGSGSIVALRHVYWEKWQKYYLNDIDLSDTVRELCHFHGSAGKSPAE